MQNIKHFFKERDKLTSNEHPVESYVDEIMWKKRLSLLEMKVQDQKYVYLKNLEEFNIFYQKEEKQNKK